MRTKTPSELKVDALIAIFQPIFEEYAYGDRYDPIEDIIVLVNKAINQIEAPNKPKDNEEWVIGTSSDAIIDFLTPLLIEKEGKNS